ncbi:AcrR family transcriptional regulator [Lipingzhangella halophila]|uniref:AcrR family transcriptional regulator n=1 Tax=Lipingzhangella halophila TaxID=1783352 RepID=A0A7W7RDN0_9ACTN|nr:TetR/AcrR family transcriptional regulator [Lipingzhangella halophila]MBB4930082.1 AcrR family transcriptional regulator [Lipingzhangella halophila]
MNQSAESTYQPRLTPAGRRVLDAASELFYREGLHAVGVESIAQAAGVTKKTLYDCFGSKDELIATYLRRRDGNWRAWLVDFVDRNADTPADKLLAVFDGIAYWQQTKNARGCAFINALAELPEDSGPARTAIHDQKRWMIEYLTGLVAQAGHPGPETLGRQLFLLQEAAFVADGTGIPDNAIQLAKDTAAALIASSRADPG